MGSHGYLWSNQEVKRWAKKYMVKKATLITVEETLGVSHSTMWLAFQTRLEGIDPDLYDRVMVKLEENHHMRIRRNK